MEVTFVRVLGGPYWFWFAEYQELLALWEYSHCCDAQIEIMLDGLSWWVGGASLVHFPCRTSRRIFPGQTFFPAKKAQDERREVVDTLLGCDFVSPIQFSKDGVCLCTVFFNLKLTIRDSYVPKKVFLLHRYTDSLTKWPGFYLRIVFADVKSANTSICISTHLNDLKPSVSLVS